MKIDIHKYRWVDRYSIVALLSLDTVQAKIMS